jgi:hypothetical protein
MSNARRPGVKTVLVLGLLGVAVLLSLHATHQTWGADTAPPQPSEAKSPFVQDPATQSGLKENLSQVRSMCEADAKRICPHVIPGGGRILRCLQEHDSDLSADCRQALKQRQPKQ